MFYLINPKAITREFLSSCVQKGAVYLDETQGDSWTQRIAIDRLDISCGDRCVCGQLFGQYDQRPNAVLDGWRFGFNLPAIEDCIAELGSDSGTAMWHMLYNSGHDSAWEVLDLAWLEEIWWRLPEPTAEKKAAWVKARRAEQMERRLGKCSECGYYQSECDCDF